MQCRPIAAAAVASTDPLGDRGRRSRSRQDHDARRRLSRSPPNTAEASRVVAPTLRAAQVAHEELGVPATSRCRSRATRMGGGGTMTAYGDASRRGDLDPDNGRTFTGPPRDAVLRRGERVIVDEAGMLDQDTAHALLTITAEAGATVALVGDRAQLARRRSWRGARHGRADSWPHLRHDRTPPLH